MKRIAIIQSNYIPWKGYFDLIGSVDAFVFLDDVQFTRRDWRNRNKIKTAQGSIWLTVPVVSKGKYEQQIRETEVLQDGWEKKHLGSLYHSYSKAPFFKNYWQEVESLYAGAPCMKTISDLNWMFASRIMNFLGIETPVFWSHDIPHAGDKEQRLISICKAMDATHYLSGPAAADYIPDGAFEQACITLEYADYSGYPEYPQLHGAFDPYVSILDLLFNTGDSASDFMKYKTNKTSIIKKAA